MPNVKATLFDVKVEDNLHTIFETHEFVSEDGANERWNNISDVQNIVMIDVSGSMHSYWNAIYTNWNKIISPQLKGHTMIFTFGRSVHLLRKETFLESSDFLSESTNLTEAIETINDEIQKSNKNFIHVLLITDGHHNATSVTPDVEIAKLVIPIGKTIEVYLLGIGNHFPVEYSITIRSALHNGNSNVPSLFWAKFERNADVDEEIKDQILNIEEVMKKSNVQFKLSPPGQLAPGLPNTTITHLGEFIYYQRPSVDVITELNLCLEDNTKITLEISRKQINLEYLSDKVFRQWNSLLIQQHRKGCMIPTESFEVMEKIHDKLLERLRCELNESDDKKDGIKQRLQKKKVKSLEVEFATMMNQSKNVIGLEGKYATEIELAQNILQTTVKSKYDHRNLKLKGHSMDSYAEDVQEFLTKYEGLKQDILSLPEPSADECCRVTMGSFIKDLQDSSLPDLLSEDKFTLMRNLTITGIPIYAPVKDSSQINSWTLCIKSILNSPYTIISQNTLELSADLGNLCSGSEDKDVFLQENDENTRFNAIIPVIGADVAAVVKPLIRTNLFAMLSTFCILKNPHIIDHNAHIAALGCAWMKTISDFPKTKRPEFVINRLSQIETTGKLYLDRAGISKYLHILLTNPTEALMSESELYKTEKKAEIKCESLIKPTFLLYLSRKDEVKEKLLSIIPLLLTELIGRCLAGGNQQPPLEECVYSQYFVPGLNSKEKREAWFAKKVQDTCSAILSSFIQEKGEIIQTYFTLEDLRRALKQYCLKELKFIGKRLYEISVNVSRIYRLKNTGSAGNIQLSGIVAFAQEMGIAEDKLQEILDTKQIFVHVLHALQNKKSKDRMTTPLPSYEEALKKVEDMVAQENDKKFRALAYRKIMEEADRRWTAEFLTIHKSVVVKPLCRSEILNAATAKGTHVNEETFDKVFRYNSKSGLLRNACMVEGCHFYLQPNRRFNQHIFRERQTGYPHQLHKICQQIAKSGGQVSDAIEILQKGKTKIVGRKTHPNPDEEILRPLTEQLQALLIQYKKLEGEA